MLSPSPMTLSQEVLWTQEQENKDDFARSKAEVQFRNDLRVGSRREWAFNSVLYTITVFYWEDQRLSYKEKGLDDRFYMSSRLVQLKVFVEGGLMIKTGDFSSKITAALPVGEVSPYECQKNSSSV